MHVRCMCQIEEKIKHIFEPMHVYDALFLFLITSQWEHLINNILSSRPKRETQWEHLISFPHFISS
jgi:hypothetical protein